MLAFKTYLLKGIIFSLTMADQDDEVFEGPSKSEINGAAEQIRKELGSTAIETSIYDEDKV